MPVRLRPAVLDDAEALAALARSQREHLAPWEPERPTHWFTEAGQREALEQAEHDRAADRSYAFLITDAAVEMQRRFHKRASMFHTTTSHLDLDI